MKDGKWIPALAGAMMLLWAMGALLPAPQPVAAAMAPVEENLFAVETPAPDTAFSIEVLSVAEEKEEPLRVLIYHTHTYEAFEQVQDDPYRETEKWRTADSDHNMVRVGAELAALLRSLGMEVTHDATAFEPPSLSSAYTRSLEMIRSRQAAGESYDLYIDLHRDAYAASYGGSNTVSVGGTPAARLMLLVGKGEGQTGQGFAEKPDWESNLAIAQKITDALNEQADGLCRDVCIKTGRFNQHVADACILIEAGNNKNTLSEVLSAMPYLADAIHLSMMEK